ncbi:MAG: hypothetical protein F9K49_00120 [Caedimonadaceae bacterium]|nr:MAG: hypothetical protein F9K49_00120 [Caedimonadaceae bacterium]
MNEILNEEFHDKAEIRQALQATPTALALFNLILKSDHFIMNGAYAVPIETDTLKEIFKGRIKKLGSFKKAKEEAFKALLYDADILGDKAGALYMFFIVPLSIRPRRRITA